MATAPVFHRFPDLPAELRFKIWRLTRHAIGPSLCPYRYDARDYSVWLDNWTLALTRMTPAPHFVSNRLQIALAYPQSAKVNHEARAEVMRGIAGASNGHFIRPFDRSQDVLYFRSTQIGRLGILANMLRDVNQGLQPDALVDAVQLAVGEQTLLYTQWQVINPYIPCDLGDIRRLLASSGVLYFVRSVPEGELNGCREFKVRGVWTWNRRMGVFESTAPTGHITRGPNNRARDRQLGRAIQNLAGDDCLQHVERCEIREVEIVI